jgi:glutamate-1-semialdehyde 2,1-aminomutase
MRTGKGQSLYKKAKTLIPGGTMLLSKRPEMFLPEQWPAYFSRSKGCTVWDLDDNAYLDVSIMAIGTNTLGYGNERVDAAVRAVIDKGNMSTFNCPEEVALAEKLVELHPWGDMVRLARSGGEANAIAIRIARAASGRDKVAICGYHGWHDWYLSANLGETDELDGHLLPGLDPAGVPRHLKGSVLTFPYNDLDALRALIAQHPDLGVVKMEVSRNMGPAEGYLEGVRQLCDQHGLVLIFDECTSGFRETYGGLHKKYGVAPDMCMFGKALGNGYAITAVLGRRSVMEAAQKTFISSTFWTERIGPAAALATLEEMAVQRSWEVISEQGRKIGQRWKALGASLSLPLSVAGLPALTSFGIDAPDWLKYKTFITQEMLRQGFLAGNSVYVCTQHTDAVLEQYFEAFAPVLARVADFFHGRGSVDEALEGPVCHGGFKRLN